MADVGQLNPLDSVAQGVLISPDEYTFDDVRGGALDALSWPIYRDAYLYRNGNLLIYANLALRVLSITGNLPSGLTLAITTRVQSGRIAPRYVFTPRVTGILTQEAGRYFVTYKYGFLSNGIDAPELGIATVPLEFIVRNPTGGAAPPTDQNSQNTTPPTTQPPARPLTWFQARAEAFAGTRIRRISWADRYFEHSKGIWWIQTFSPVTKAMLERRVVLNTDFGESDFRAKDWTTDGIAGQIPGAGENHSQVDGSTFP